MGNPWEEQRFKTYFHFSCKRNWMPVFVHYCEMKQTQWNSLIKCKKPWNVHLEFYKFKWSNGKSYWRLFRVYSEFRFRFGQNCSQLFAQPVFFYSSKQLQNARLGSLSILWNVEEKNHVHQKMFMQTNGCMLKVKMWI